MTLAKLTAETRIFLKIGGAGVVLIFLLFLIFQGASVVQKTFFPAPPAPPEEKFGKLSKVNFPEQDILVPEFRVNTVAGVLPSFPNQIRVYELVKNAPDITALSSARQKAASLGFTQNEKQVNVNTYRWSNTSQNSFLLYNINSFNFSVDSDYLERGDFISGVITENEDITRLVSEFVQTLSANTSDIDFNKSSYSYFISSNNELREVPTLTNATFAKIFLYQNPIDNLSIYYPTTEPSLLYFTVGNNNSLTVVEAAYDHFVANPSSSSTYAIKSTSEAFEDLKNGKGYILNQAESGAIDITDVVLGYYLSRDPEQRYLLPIFVFSGKDNFKAYVSAL